MGSTEKYILKCCILIFKFGALSVKTDTNRNVKKKLPNERSSSILQVWRFQRSITNLWRSGRISLWVLDICNGDMYMDTFD